MKHLIWILPAFAAVLCCGCGSSEGYHRQGYDFYQVNKIAIVDVTGPVSSEAVKNRISDYFVMELLKKGYSPVDRAQIQALLKKQGFQASDFSSSENVAEAGELLNAATVMFINIPEFDEEISMNAKLVNTRDGSILWIGSGSGKIDEGMAAMFDAITGVFDGNQKEKMSDNNTLDVMTPETEAIIHEITKQVCKTLPRRR